MTKSLILDALIGIIVCIVGVFVLSSSSPDIVSEFSANISNFIPRVLGR